MTKPTIFADFNNADARGRLRLNTVGTIRDLAEQGLELYDGLTLTVHDEELQVDGRVCFSPEENLWVAVIDWGQVHLVGQAGIHPARVDSES
jgi:hypothetical protein